MDTQKRQSNRWDLLRRKTSSSSPLEQQENTGKKIWNLLKLRLSKPKPQFYLGSGKFLEN
jgi:hypothetical protein